MCKIILNYKYKVKPNKEQELKLWRTLQSCRHLYNEALEMKITCWDECKIGVTKYDLEYYCKNTHKDLYAKIKQNVTDRLDTSFQNFFNKRTKFPKFKSQSQYRSFTYPQYPGNGFKFLSQTKLRLSRIGDVKIILHRPIIGKIKTCTLKCSKTNEWYAIFAVEVQPNDFFETPTCTNNDAVGLDIGIKTFASLSDGTQIANPHFLKHSLKKLKMAQRRLSKKKKGSKNRNKQRIKVAKLHEHIANQRRDFHFKTAHELVNKYHLIACEDLSPKFMLANHKLAQAASDVGISQFFDILSYEAFKHNTLVGYVNPYNTSQMCSCCKKIVSKDLSVRVHQCPYCGFVCDRDINAAINIVDGIPDALKQKHNLLRNGTAGVAETLTPVEMSASTFKPIGLEASAIAEAGMSIAFEH